MNDSNPEHPFVIDSHQHVWDLARAPYAWPTAEQPEIFRTIEHGEIAPTLQRLGIGGTVLVQANDSDQDTDLMLEVAARVPQILGVVGYVPLHDPQTAAARLSELRKNPAIVGIRNLIHDRSDPEWLLRDDVSEGISLIADAGLPLDIPAETPAHLEQIDAIAARHPELTLVIDHLGKPPIKGKSSESWNERINRVAQHPRVFAKISGLYPSVGNLTQWTPEDLRPFTDHAVSAFGAARLMYGSDWPVSILAGGYDAVWNGITHVLSGLSHKEQSSILSGTATEVYGLNRAIGAGNVETPSH
ncbi:amidohydrolase family protein [Lysinibacter cavernae]|uniref:L-fuconolactonase n=1 Tax=Lysinibacter cavernae TaxID=1640652 RepID=A0A7X5R3C3_9MICO|nr:L-fuconolactonase [Lysinibacter cavernae]